MMTKKNNDEQFKHFTSFYNYVCRTLPRKTKDKNPMVAYIYSRVINTTFNYQIISH